MAKLPSVGVFFETKGVSTDYAQSLQVRQGLQDLADTIRRPLDVRPGSRRLKIANNSGRVVMDKIRWPDMGAQISVVVAQSGIYRNTREVTAGRQASSMVVRQERGGIQDVVVVSGGLVNLRSLVFGQVAGALASESVPLSRSRVERPEACVDLECALGNPVGGHAREISEVLRSMGGLQLLSLPEALCGDCTGVVQAGAARLFNDANGLLV